MQIHIQKATTISPQNVQRKEEQAFPLEIMQRMQSSEEEELLQGKFDVAQRMPELEEKEMLQAKFENAFGDRKSRPEVPPIQRKINNTGLPDQLKSGIENLSGHAMDDVKVHYNSDQPAQLNAHAYAQGTDIHLGPGQEKHLPHEAWHVVQQKQGRVRPTMQMKGKVNVNDDVGLEREADVMGERALQRFANGNPIRRNKNTTNWPGKRSSEFDPVQAVFITENLGKDRAYRQVYEFVVSQGESGEVIEPEKEATITATNAGESIFLLLHGSQPVKDKPGTIMFWEPKKLLEILLKAGFDPAKHTGNITLLSCYAGTSAGDVPSYAERLSALLQKAKYSGKVYAVDGSVNAPQAAKQDPKSKGASLWQSDLTHITLQEVKLALSTGIDPLYDIINYLDGDEEPKELKTVAAVTASIYKLLDAFEAVKSPIKAVAGVGDVQKSLSGWQDEVKEYAFKMFAEVKGQKVDRVSDLPQKNKTALFEAIEKALSLLETLESIIIEYAKSREKEGYVQGLSHLFKPADFKAF